MANTLITKNSSSAANVPSAGELVEGELAVNTADRKLYSKTATTVFELTDHDYLANNGGNAHIDWTAASAAFSTTGGATITNGTKMGSATAASVTDLSEHLALWGTTYGFCITGNTLNAVAAGTNTLSSTSSLITSKVAHSFTAGINMADTDLNRPVIEDYGIKHTAPTVSGNAVTVNCVNGNSFAIDMDPATAAVALTLSNPPVSGTYGEVTLHIIMGTPAWGITWPGSVVWFAGGTAPTLTTVNNGVDTVHLYTIDGGTTWYGTYALRDAAATVTNLNSLSDVVITSAVTGDILRHNGSNWVDYPDSNYATSGHTHSAFDRASSVLSGATVFSNIVVTDGITTAVATRAMSINDLGGPYSNNAGTVTAVNNGNGMNFTNITTSGTVTMGTPGTLSATSTNAVTTSSHTHSINSTIARLASPSFTGTVSLPTTEMADSILRRPYIDDYALFRSTVTATASTTLTYSTAQVWAITMNANITTLTISGEPASGRYGEMTLKLIYNSATARTIAWANGIKWGEPGAPTLTSVSGKHDVVHLWTDDAGASWYGSYILNY